MLFRGQVAIQDNPALAEAGWLGSVRGGKRAACVLRYIIRGLHELCSLRVRICPNTESRRTPTTLPESPENLAAYERDRHEQKRGANFRNRNRVRIDCPSLGVSACPKPKGVYAR